MSKRADIEEDIYRVVQEYITGVLFETRAAFRLDYEAEVERLNLRKSVGTPEKYALPCLNLLDEVALEDLFFVESSVGKFDAAYRHIQKSGVRCVHCQLEMDKPGLHFVNSRGRHFNITLSAIETRQIPEYFMFYHRNSYDLATQELFYSYEQILFGMGLEGMRLGLEGERVRVCTICASCLRRAGSDSLRAVASRATKLALDRIEAREAFVRDTVERLPVAGLEALVEEFVWLMQLERDYLLYQLEPYVEQMEKALHDTLTGAVRYGGFYLYGSVYVRSVLELRVMIEEKIARHLFLRQCIRGEAKIYPVEEHVGFCLVGEELDEVAQMYLYERVRDFGAEVSGINGLV